MSGNASDIPIFKPQKNTLHKNNKNRTIIKTHLPVHTSKCGNKKHLAERDFFHGRSYAGGSFKFSYIIKIRYQYDDVIAEIEAEF